MLSGRFTMFDDLAWFDKTINRIVMEEMGEEKVDLVNKDSYYVDFLR